jgi:hypothetical protein
LPRKEVRKILKEQEVKRRIKKQEEVLWQKKSSSNALAIPKKKRKYHPKKLPKPLPKSKMDIKPNGLKPYEKYGSTNKYSKQPLYTIILLKYIVEKLITIADQRD